MNLIASIMYWLIYNYKDIIDTSSNHILSEFYSTQDDKTHLFSAAGNANL